MNEQKDQVTSPDTPARKGRDVQNRDLYTASPKRIETVRRKAAEYFQTMRDENSTYAQRAEAAGMSEETYRLGDAFADMSKFLIEEAYVQMKELKDPDAEQQFFQEIHDGLGKLLGIDGLTADHIESLRTLWEKAAGKAKPEREFSLTPVQKAELDKRRQAIEDRRKKKAQEASSS